jgi:hypothetical protein
VLAEAGVHVPMSDLFGVGGQQLLAGTRLSGPSRSRVDSAMRVITTLDFEIELFTKLVAGRLRFAVELIAMAHKHSIKRLSA